ncbi:MAG: iron-containing alcohol dehydrogenase [Clostridiales bacterium]|jgi:alcohol dehydrogenase YqhD (iron-dependent ADH family)|nr:iron-containing alcohol dehydrogenase [Clostridiales bacterium]
MNNFTLNLPTKLVFGKDQHKNIGEYIKPIANKILIHYGSQRIKQNGIFDDVTSSLKAHGIEWVELGGAQPNPRVTLVRKGIELCRAENVELVLAIGGGSAIDSAKGIAAGMFYNGDVWDLYENQLEIDKCLPVATILTIPAAGSEMSLNSVVTNEETGYKWGYGSELLRPKVSIVNPEFFFTLPKNQIANGVSDMMCHIFERYFTNTNNVELTSALCEATLRTIIANAPKLMQNPSDYNAWAEVGFSGTIAHNGLLGCGREEDWATHAIEHEVSAIYDIAHGAGLAILAPNWMRVVGESNPDRMQKFAKNVMGVDDIDEAINKLEAFYKSLGMATKLSEIDIDDSHFDEMVTKIQRNKSFANGTIGHFMPLDVAKIKRILELSL